MKSVPLECRRQACRLTVVMHSPLRKGGGHESHSDGSRAGVKALDRAQFRGKGFGAFLGDGVGGVPGKEPCSCRFRFLPGQLGAGQSFRDGFRQGLRILGRHQPSAGVVEKFSRGGRAGGDDGAAGGHGLQEDQLPRRYGQGEQWHDDRGGPSQVLAIRRSPQIVKKLDVGWHGEALNVGGLAGDMKRRGFGRKPSRGGKQGGIVPAGSAGGKQVGRMAWRFGGHQWLNREAQWSKFGSGGGKLLAVELDFALRMAERDAEGGVAEGDGEQMPP